MIGVAALQTAYRDVTTSNGQLSSANLKLTQANQEIKDSRDLTRDALDRIVNRVRDNLHDVPQATQLMVETSRDSLELHRRLHAMQPNDMDITRSYVDSLYTHVYQEKLYGDSEKGELASRELESELSDLIPRHPKDLKLRVTRLKAILNQVAYHTTGTASSSIMSTEVPDVQQSVAELLRDYPLEPEALKLASLASAQKMTEAANTNDRVAFLAAARERVTYSRRYAEAEANNDSQRMIARIWRAQAERILAQALLIANEPAEAQQVLKESLEQLNLADPKSGDRAWRYEKAQHLIDTARVHELQEEAATALLAYTDALLLFAGLVQDHPTDVSFRSSLALALVRSAALSSRHGKPEVSIEQLATADFQVREILKLSPDNAEALSLQEAIPRFRLQIQEKIEPALPTNVANTPPADPQTVPVPIEPSPSETAP